MLSWESAQGLRLLSILSQSGTHRDRGRRIHSFIFAAPTGLLPLHREPPWNGHHEDMEDTLQLCDFTSVYGFYSFSFVVSYTLPSPSKALSQRILATLRVRTCSHSHFADVNTEPQRIEVIPLVSLTVIPGGKLRRHLLNTGSKPGALPQTKRLPPAVQESPSMARFPAPPPLARE